MCGRRWNWNGGGLFRFVEVSDSIKLSALVPRSFHARERRFSAVSEHPEPLASVLFLKFTQER